MNLNEATTGALSRADLERWGAELRRYVHRLTGDADLSEDVAQDAVLRLLRAPEPIDTPRPWLFRAATNLVRDRARHESMRQRRPPPVERDPDTPVEDLERAQRIAGVRAVLARLSERDRELLILRESGFRHAEIAEVMGVATGSVSVLAARALERFRKLYMATQVADAS